MPGDRASCPEVGAALSVRGSLLLPLSCGSWCVLLLRTEGCDSGDHVWDVAFERDNSSSITRPGPSWGSITLDIGETCGCAFRWCRKLVKVLAFG